MSDDKNLDAVNLNYTQLTEDELSQASGGMYKHISRYISCNKDYCGFVKTDGRILYVQCEGCHHAMHFETHSFGIIHWFGHYYCDKCDYNCSGQRFETWHGTEQELIDSANAAL